MAIDTDWALGELKHFIGLASRPRVKTAFRTKGDDAELIASAQVVEQILDRVFPRWHHRVVGLGSLSDYWARHREAAQRAVVTLEREAEIREKLGDNAPQISASTFHPWAWEGASSLWQSGHFREAVTAAARKINAEAQNKLERRDLSEIKLFQEALSANAPAVGRPRLRIVPDDGSDTYKSTQRGVMAFAEGCFAAIRNPNSHEDSLPELPEAEALEQLAALSLLARWIDSAAVESTS
ncbi:TIGR02391 family protein [Kitasatospora sp. NPDC101183]|uniref:TIGR02391 family protein n=1 Tax=Kitasatospora sp. NPDC101183 TaxID=3364100 RepID=UPI003818CA9F